jgi:hypothetical protein
MTWMLSKQDSERVAKAARSLVPKGASQYIIV